MKESLLAGKREKKRGKRASPDLRKNELF